ncbi:AraC family transcriptional regulator [Sphingobium nicotianae]|uniref:Helix-turn-helix transcriptional regulator n=1 Tax=Sphingobium nicotianae TaxID=2782607 RepID=A0A9X1DA39_9SPHN|nr:AraC family transcriptional regulator [Sphingobium nicotianae]MBT2186078.1 helix-turn-helix transcriptional regulator [Sphingobium nicotianae]
METMQVTSSTVPDPKQRIGVISEMISETFFSHWHAGSIDGNEPQADIQASHALGMRLSHARMSALTLRNRADVSSENLKFYAYVTNQSQSVKLTDTAALHLPPQELLILSSDMPCEIVNPKAYTTTSLVIDAELFKEFVPDHQGLIAQRLSYPFGLRELLHSTLDTCIAISAAGKFAEVGPQIVRSFLEMLSVVAVQKPELPISPASTSLDIRRGQVKAFIERYYTQPDLTIAEIAHRLQLTPRYVQLAFEGQGTTPSEYLRQCRLEGSARQLRDPRCSHRSVTDIAFSNGFNSSSHFSTEFRRSFGMTPRTWRTESAAMLPSDLSRYFVDCGQAA